MDEDVVRFVGNEFAQEIDLAKMDILYQQAEELFPYTVGIILVEDMGNNHVSVRKSLHPGVNREKFLKVIEHYGRTQS